MLKKFLIPSLCLVLSNISFANSLELAGFWRSIDDKTGFSKGIVEITKNEQGIYTGKIVEVIPRPGYTPKTQCVKCPAPYTNQPILGLTVLNNMKAHEKNSGEYVGGTILDPLSGKLYRSQIKLNATGSRLSLRGFIGIEILGRNQHWVRYTP